MKILKNYSFRKKIFAGMLLAAIVPMLIGYLVMLQVFQITYRNNLNQGAETVLNATAGSLDSAFSHIYEALQQLGEKETIKNNLKLEAGTDSAVYRELYSATSEYGEYAYFSIYDAQGYKVTSVVNNSYIRDKLPLDWGLLYEAERMPGECVVRNARIYEGEKRVEYLRIATAVCDESGKVIGYVVAVVDNGKFDHMLNGIVNGNEGVIYAMDNFHETVYCSADAYDDDELRLARQQLLEKEKAGEPLSCLGTDKNYFYYMRYEESCRLYLFYRQPVAALGNMRSNVVTIAVLSGIVGIAICIFLSGYISSLIYQPIKRMQKAMSEIRKGNFQTKIVVDSQDELGQLSDSFNVMSEHLTENMERLLLRERELSEANIKMMQAQLNPHFLYNTLDTMKWLGKANQVPEVATLSAGLAKILRMSISAKSKIRLSQEIELVDAYVQIQKIRFADKFEFIVDLPEELADCLVPKLILQPIVENAILHGLAERENGTVLVLVSRVQGAPDTQETVTMPETAHASEAKLLIVVQDDGAGMPPEQLERLNDSAGEKERQSADGGSKQSGKHSIGYFNVNEIIRLNYGEAYGLRAESESGVGTKISMLLPVRKEENDV